MPPPSRRSLSAGQRTPRIAGPAGLTQREIDVIRLLARGLQTKQIAHVLGISVKTADNHIQNAYSKIGVSREQRPQSSQCNTG